MSESVAPMADPALTRSSSNMSYEYDDDDGTLDEEGSCCCCHCGAGPDASKNKSYQKMREHLQQRLRAKSAGMSSSSACDSSTGSRSSSSKSAVDSNINGYAELDYLVSYIEGKKSNDKAPVQPNPKRAAKRARQKAKKIEQQKAEEEAAAEAAAKKAAEKAAAQGKHQAHSSNKGAQDRVPNGMVRITHNPLTNSAVITPLYGPLEPTPSYLQQPPSLTSQHARMAPPKSPSVDTPLKTSNSTAPAQQQKPPASSLPTSSNPSQPQQMVTIRRVMQPNLSEPVVTVTLKGDTPDYDRVLFTLVNGQVLPTGAPGSAPAQQPPTPSSNHTASSVVPPPPAPAPISRKKQKKNEKKKQKKLLQQAASNAEVQPQQQHQQTQQTQLNVQMHPGYPAPPSSFHQQPNDFTLDNFRLPPGITLTRVQGTHVPTHPELPVRMVDRATSKKDSASPTGPNPIIVTNPPKAKESMGTLGGLAAPNVIVVDTRKIQPQPQSQKPVQMCSVAVQTGWDANDVDESQLSKKQRKKLRRKQEQEQQAVMEQLAALELNKKAAGKTKNSNPANASTSTKASSATAKQPPAPAPSAKTASGKNKKKKRTAAANGQASGEDKWDESVFVPKSDLDLEGGDLDEDERELEAFKRFCFNTVPPERKEKVRIHLNVKDIFGKKSSASNGGLQPHPTSCK